MSTRLIDRSLLGVGILLSFATVAFSQEPVPNESEKPAPKAMSRSEKFEAARKQVDEAAIQLAKAREALERLEATPESKAKGSKKGKKKPALSSTPMPNPSPVPNAIGNTPLPGGYAVPNTTLLSAGIPNYYPSLTPTMIPGATPIDPVANVPAPYPVSPVVPECSNVELKRDMEKMKKELAELKKMVKKLSAPQSLPSISD